MEALFPWGMFPRGILANNPGDAATLLKHLDNSGSFVYNKHRK
jgi:hypothetical protein